MVGDAPRRFVKICGLREEAHVRAVIDAGADALGFILAPSRRQISLDAIEAIRAVLTTAERLPTVVAVTVNASRDALDSIAESGAVDLVQLSGDESPSIRDDLSLPFLKAMRFGPGTTVDQALRAIEPWIDHPLSSGKVHIDTFDAGRYGGTGKIGDWALATRIAAHIPIVLAGGLTPGNVNDAIRQVDPAGVDVSGGVEVGGTKDAAAIQAFIAAARRPLADDRPLRRS